MCLNVEEAGHHGVTFLFLWGYSTDIYQVSRLWFNQARWQKAQSNSMLQQTDKRWLRSVALMDSTACASGGRGADHAGCWSEQKSHFPVNMLEESSYIWFFSKKTQPNTTQTNTHTQTKPQINQTKTLKKKKAQNKTKHQNTKQNKTNPSKTVMCFAATHPHLRFQPSSRL